MNEASNFDILQKVHNLYLFWYNTAYLILLASICFIRFVEIQTYRQNMEPWLSLDVFSDTLLPLELLEWWGKRTSAFNKSTNTTKHEEKWNFSSVNWAAIFLIFLLLRHLYVTCVSQASQRLQNWRSNNHKKTLVCW